MPRCMEVAEKVILSEKFIAVNSYIKKRKITNMQPDITLLGIKKMSKVQS